MCNCEQSLNIVRKNQRFFWNNFPMMRCGSKIQKNNWKLLMLRTFVWQRLSEQYAVQSLVTSNLVRTLQIATTQHVRGRTSIFIVINVLRSATDAPTIVTVSYPLFVFMAYLIIEKLTDLRIFNMSTIPGSYELGFPRVLMFRRRLCRPWTDEQVVQGKVLKSKQKSRKNWRLCTCSVSAFRSFMSKSAVNRGHSLNNFEHWANLNRLQLTQVKTIKKRRCSRPTFV